MKNSRPLPRGSRPEPTLKGRPHGSRPERFKVGPRPRTDPAPPVFEEDSYLKSREHGAPARGRAAGSRLIAHASHADPPPSLPSGTRTAATREGGFNFPHSGGCGSGLSAGEDPLQCSNAQDRQETAVRAGASQAGQPAPARTGTAASCGRAAGASAQPSGRAPWAYVFRPCLVIRTGPHAVACERGQGTSDNSRPDT